jgi:hypothetical protein
VVEEDCDELLDAIVDELLLEVAEEAWLEDELEPSTCLFTTVSVAHVDPGCTVTRPPGGSYVNKFQPAGTVSTIVCTPGAATLSINATPVASVVAVNEGLPSMVKVNAGAGTI